MSRFVSTKHIQFVRRCNQEKFKECDKKYERCTHSCNAEHVTRQYFKNVKTRTE